ncbi:hypothetical protein R83H12_01282 [Fibrobacteria bacterium R8-3-H12]
MHFSVKFPKSSDINHKNAEKMQKKCRESKNIYIKVMNLYINRRSIYIISMNAHKLIAIFFAILATMAQTAQAATAEQLKATIDSYGLVATVQPTMTGNPIVTVTGTKTDATSTLNLDIDATVTVVWQAELTGNVGNDGSAVGPLSVPYCRCFGLQRRF